MPSPAVLRFLAWVPVCIGVLFGCSESQPAEAPHLAPSGPLLASTWPMTTLARAILGDAIPVECLLQPGEDPAHWMPNPDEISLLMRAPAVLINGAGLEGWLMAVNLAPTRVIDVSSDFSEGWIRHEGDLQHSHGNRGAHSHKGVDPHVWMDPLLALEQARVLQRQAVQRGWIQGDLAAARGAALESRLRELDRLWSQVAVALRGHSLLANHDAYAYPGQRYGLAIHVVDADPALSLTPALAEELRSAAQAHNPLCMLFESQPHATLVRYLTETLQLTPLVFSPAESPSERDAIDSMATDLGHLLQFLQEQEPPR